MFLSVYVSLNPSSSEFIIVFNNILTLTGIFNSLSYKAQGRIIRKGSSCFCHLQRRKEKEELKEKEVARQSLHPDVSQVPSNAPATISRRTLFLL